MPHRDPLAVEAQDQQVAGGLCLTQSIGVEGIEVLRRAHCQLLDLTLGHVCAGARSDQLHDLVERRPGTLLGDQAPNLQRILLRRQSECRIERRQPLAAWCLVELAADLNRAEQRLYLTARGLDLRAFDAVSALNDHASLPSCLRVVVRLHHLPEQLAPLLGEKALDLIVRRRHRLVVGEVVFDVAHQAARLAEGAVAGDRLYPGLPHRATDLPAIDRSGYRRRDQPSGITSLRADAIDPHPTLLTLTDVDGPTSRRRGGPVGKMQQLFEEGSKLPRRQQEKIIEVVSAMIDQYRRRAS